MPQSAGGLPPMMNHQVRENQLNKMQFVQYECLKTELKEEYDKKINFIHKRMETRNTKPGPYFDANQILQSTSINDPRILNKRASHNTKYFSNSTSGLAANVGGPGGFDMDFLAHGTNA